VAARRNNWMVMRARAATTAIETIISVAGIVENSCRFGALDGSWAVFG
jgi:hypothetical protein